MTDTVAVALITSLSTLTAAGLTGAVSAFVTGRQLRHQHALAREQRAEQRAVAHREVCREVCERFLSQADAAYRVLDAGWNAPQSVTAGGEQGFAARRALDEAYIRLQLAGPPDLATRGAAVVTSVGEEFRLLAGAGDSAARARALRARTTVTDAFTHTARRALGPDGRETSALPDPP